jgi:hypothetical protein
MRKDEQGAEKREAHGEQPQLGDLAERPAAAEAAERDDAVTGGAGKTGNVEYTWKVEEGESIVRKPGLASP